MVWQNYGMVVGNKFYFHGGPFGLNWDIDGLTFMQKMLYVKAVCLANELAPSVLALDIVGKEKNLYKINNIKKLNHAKRMIDQELLRIYNGLTDLYGVILENRQTKKRYEALLTVLEQVRDGEQTNPWFLVFAQRQIYNLA